MEKNRSSAGVLLAGCVILLATVQSFGQTGSVNEPVRYVGGPRVFPPAHDGQLRPVVGVENIQVMRANRTQRQESDGFGWTYNHAPMIAYWNGRFYVEYLSNPVSEHVAPGQTFLCTSTDGRRWDFPKVVFPVLELPPPDPPGSTAMMHQRMGFFAAPNGRFLVSAFYGRAPNPFRAGGIARVVREIQRDGAFGPIYALRFNSASGWDEQKTRLPSYKRSSNRGFIEACDALLENRLMRQQWWDEERIDDGSFSPKARTSREAFNWFTRKDGKVVGLWKWSLAALSSDDGQTWSDPVRVPTLQMTGAKISGRRTSDGRFALVYDPNIDDDHRWPLAVVTGEDGIVFDNMLCVHGEVPPRRFAGRYKDYGPQYNRIVEEGNGGTPGSDLWVTYSMNKEDIWITRIPVPIRREVKEPVSDNFDDLPAGGAIPNWNIYRPRWAPVAVVDFPSATNKSLELRDKDPYDYARAVRVFPETRSARIDFKVHSPTPRTGRLEIDVVDQFGYRPVRLVFDGDGKIKTHDGAKLIDLSTYDADRWYKVNLTVDVAQSRFDVSLDGRAVASAGFAESVKSVERLSFRTGAYREEPTLKTATAGQPDLVNPNPDLPVEPAIYHVDDVKITTD